MVLVVVLILIALLSLSGYTFSEMMISEYRAAELTVRQAQARVQAESGVEAARVFLAQDLDVQQQTGGWYDNPAQFHAVVVADDARATRRGRFTFVAPRIESGTQDGVRYGLENESAKLNLNLVLQVAKASTSSPSSSSTSSASRSTSSSATPSSSTSTENAGRTMLMALPGMTEDVADAILDWLDSDDETRELGAEADYYSSLEPAYAPRNGLPKTLEELLRVRGVTASLLFGADANRNGVIDGNESSSSLFLGSENADDTSARGWSAYLTLYSAESTAKSDGTAKVKLNQSDMQQLSNELQQYFSAEQAKYVVIYRQYGPASCSSSPSGSSKGTWYERRPRWSDRLLISLAGGALGPVSLAVLADTGSSTSGSATSTSGSSSGSSASRGTRTGSSSSSDSSSNSTTGTLSSLQLDYTTQATTQLSSVLDLLESSVTVDNKKYASPFTKEDLDKLMENTTTATGSSIVGRVNINRAPRAVLAAIPGMTDEALESILALRQEDPSTPAAEQLYETWPYTQGLVDLETMKKMLPYVTTGGSVFRGTVVGYFDGGGPAVRVEVVLDATVVPPRVLFWREISQLGRGYSMADLGAESGVAGSPSTDNAGSADASPRVNNLSPSVQP